MEKDIPDLRVRLKFMGELLKCGTSVYLWHYGADGHLIESDAEQLVLDRIFERSGAKAYMVEYAKAHTQPLVLGGQLGLMWCAAFYRGEGGVAAYVLGPVFNTDISMRTIEQSVRRFDVDLNWRTGYIQLLSQLPVVSSVLFFQYGLMLHYCLTGEKLDRSDIQFQQSRRQNETAEPPERGDRMQVWLAERALLRMVSEGDLNYQRALSSVNLLSNGVRAGGEQPVLQAMVSCTSFTSLCVREAIGAGLSPELAYSVGDSYIQAMLECKTVPELRSINHAMYEDFIKRVHKLRTAPKVSPQIQACRDYIELHTGDQLTLEALARRTGYSEYHLSRKFREEMGLTITAYIRLARVERAKMLLVSTTRSLRDISDSLRFCSPSHFTRAFREFTGMTPAEYRSKNQRL